VSERQFERMREAVGMACAIQQDDREAFGAIARPYRLDDAQAELVHMLAGALATMVGPNEPEAFSLHVSGRER
jgi:hypothetical protein